MVQTMLSAAIMIPIPTCDSYITCPNCRSQVTVNSNFCNFCGKPLRPKPVVLKICPNCKKRMAEAAKYCPECGQKQ
jgi:predicted amidophosphoribosyltransferase